MTLKFLLIERLTIIAILNDFKGKIHGIYKVLKIIEKVELSDAEKKRFQGKPIDEIIKVKEEKQIDLNDDQFNILKELIEQKQDFRVDRFLISLAQKMGIILPEELPKK